MTDGCIVNAVVETVPAIQVAVTSVSTLTASVDTSSVTAEIISPVSVDAAVLTATELSSTVEEAEAITAVVESLTELAAEIQTMGMTADQIAKLNSIAWNARNFQPDYVTLVRATAYSVESGDSVPWTFTSTYAETVQWAVAHPAYRGSGIMEIDSVAKYKRNGSAGIITYELQTADDYQTENTSTATSTFGLPQSWTTALTLESPVLSASSTTETLCLSVHLIHEGNTSTDGYKQTARYHFISTDQSASPSLHEIHSISLANIDTSKDFLMRMRVKCSTSTAGDTNTVVANYVGIKHPRDGHGY